MKSQTLLLAIATAALGYKPDGWDGWWDDDSITKTTYTTVTTCPITSTLTESGTQVSLFPLHNPTNAFRTYCITELTTSTITVTDCKDCPGQVTTVPGPIVTEGTTTLVEVTYETLCPTTETIIGPGTTYVTTATITSTIVTAIPTTIYATVAGPEVTVSATDVAYTTLTSLIPVTKVTTIGGDEVTITLTTTELIVTELPTTVVETVTGPGATETTVDVDLETKTSLYEVTRTLTHPGEEVTEIVETTSTTIVVAPTTTLISQLPPPPSEPVTSEPGPTNAAAMQEAPAFALFAGIVGAVALV